jgi:hypothetical protein
LAFLQQLAVVAKKKLNWQFCKKWCFCKNGVFTKIFAKIGVFPKIGVFVKIGLFPKIGVLKKSTKNGVFAKKFSGHHCSWIWNLFFSFVKCDLSEQMWSVPVRVTRWVCQKVVQNVSKPALCWKNVIISNRYNKICCLGPIL